MDYFPALRRSETQFRRPMEKLSHSAQERRVESAAALALIGVRSAY